MLEKNGWAMNLLMDNFIMSGEIMMDLEGFSNKYIFLYSQLPYFL